MVRIFKYPLLLAAPIATAFISVLPAPVAARLMAAPEITGTQPIGPRADGTPGVNAQGLGFRGTIPHLNFVQVKSENVYNYNFLSAPSDWWMQSGQWGLVKSAQGAGWMEFSGRSREVAVIWNKRRFSGDFSYQVYFGFKPNLGNRMWMERGSDMALSFCGDGQNLSSGYSLIIGADDNRHTVLLRKGEQVAESLAPAALFPSYADGDPRRVFMSNGSTSSASGVIRSTAPETRFSTRNTEPHRWYARIEKTGKRIECWLDNNLLFSYDDPQVIDSGQFAVWTFNNSIIVPNVQIYYENEIKPASRFKSYEDSSKEEALNVVTDEGETPKDVQAEPNAR